MGCHSQGVALGYGIFAPLVLPFSDRPKCMTASKFNLMKHSIVLACPRSGTTFLAKVLGAVDHSETLIGNHLPVSVPHLVGAGLPADATAALRYGFRHSLENFLDHARNSRFMTLHKYFSGRCGLPEMLQAWRGQRRYEHLIYKEPYLVFSPRFAYETFPDTRLIHIVRDGRDCADSLVRSYHTFTDESMRDACFPEGPVGRQRGDLHIPWWVKEGSEEEFVAASPYIRCVWMWREMMRGMQNFLNEHGVRESGRVLEIRYEDLTANPRQEIERVLEHIGARMNARIDRQVRRARRGSVGIHQRLDSGEIDKATELAKEQLASYRYI